MCGMLQLWNHSYTKRHILKTVRQRNENKGNEENVVEMSVLTEADEKFICENEQL